MVEEGGSSGREWTYSGSMQWFGRRGGGVLSLWSATLILLCSYHLGVSCSGCSLLIHGAVAGTCSGGGGRCMGQYGE